MSFKEGNSTKSNKNKDFIHLNKLKNRFLGDDQELIEIFYNYLNIDELQKSKEIKFDTLKKVVADISIKFSFDFEGLNDFIISKYDYLLGLSYPLFKENLFEWIDNQLKLNLILNEEKDSENNKEKAVSFKINKLNYKIDSLDGIDLNNLIKERSHFIIKRKFDIYSEEIDKLYKFYSYDKAKQSYGFKVIFEKFEDLILNLIKNIGMSFILVEKPYDLFKIEVLEKINEEKKILIIEELIKFSSIHRKRYNNILSNKIGLENIITIEQNQKLIESNQNQIEIEKDNENEIDNEKDNRNKNRNEEIHKQNEEVVISEKENSDNSKNIEKEKKSEIKFNTNNKSENINTNKDNINYTEDQNLLKKDEISKSFISKRSIESKDTSMMNNNISKINKDKDIKEDNGELIKHKKSRESNKNEELIEKEYIYSEIILKLLLDFIEENPSVLSTDINNDLKKEVRILFDNEIFNRLGQQAQTNYESERIIKLKEYLFDKMNLENNIKIYEDLLLKKKSRRENIYFIEQMIEKLKIKKVLIDKEIQDLKENNIEDEKNYENAIEIKNNLSNINVNESINQTKLSNVNTNKRQIKKEEIRKISLKEIFTFYTKQHILIGVTFDEIQRKKEVMNLSEFVKFCVEFRIPCRKELIVEVFKKSSTLIKELTFDQFLNSIKSLAIKVNEDRISLLNERYKKLELISKGTSHLKTKEEYINQRKEMISNRLKIKSERENIKLPIIETRNKGSNDNKELDINLKIEIKEEKNKIKLLIDELKLKQFDLLYEELIIYLELDNDKAYKSKMKGFILPFHRSVEKLTQIKKKKEDPRTAAEIRRIIQQRKEEKIQKELEKERLLKLKYLEERNKIKRLNEKKHQEYERQQLKDPLSYVDIKQKEINYEREKSNKINWDQLEHLNPNYFVTNKEDDFNPKELLGEIEANESDEEQLNSIINKRDLTKDMGAIKKKTILNRSGYSDSSNNKTADINKNNNSKTKIDVNLKDKKNTFRS